jgi:hypothetical protein
MADSESLVDDFFPRLQITADKLMTREGIVSPLLLPFLHPARAVSRAYQLARMLRKRCERVVSRRVRKSRMSQFSGLCTLRANKSLRNTGELAVPASRENSSRRPLSIRKVDGL